MAKLKPNAFKLKITETELNLDRIANGDSREIKVPLDAENEEGELEGWPYLIECALKVTKDETDDVFLLKIPCSMSVAMLPLSLNMTIDEYR